MKTALVTGAAGLIGRHFTKYLVDHDWDVWPLDIKQPPYGSKEDARKFFARCDDQYDLVVHCAAHVGGRLDIENKAAYIGAYNVQLDGAMFEWALRTRPAHIIYWSSSAAYPITLQDSYGYGEALKEWHIDHTRPEQADFTYGWAKLVGERLSLEAQAEGLKVHVFRPFSGYAADQDVSYPFGAYIDRAQRRADPFVVWGDGEQVRDFIHISDVIDATMAAVDNDYPGPLNLCSGLATSFNDLARMVTAAVRYCPEIWHDLTKPEGARYRVGDPTEMHKIWVPKVSLEDGVQATLQV